MNNRLTYGSLFSGVGGFDLGFDQAGYDCVFQVEWDKHCQAVLKRHWPDVPKWENVQDVNGAAIPACDVLTFGSPCQDLSVAGKRLGLGGDKSSMFFGATRIIREMRDATGNEYPRIAVWENVPGALSSNRGADFGVVLDEMADCGALVIEWAVLDAQYFGIPQRRRRIFLVAVFDPAIASRCPDQILPVSEGGRRNNQKSNKARKGVAFNLDGCTGVGDEPMTIDGRRTDDLRVDRMGICRTLEARMGTGGNNIPVVATRTIVRRLTPVECERLMGWPDNHTRWKADGTEQADTHRYKQCGNGVATPVARWVAEQIANTATPSE